MNGYIKYHLSENRRIYCLKKKSKKPSQSLVTLTDTVVLKRS